MRDMFDQKTIKTLSEVWGGIDGKFDPAKKHWRDKSYEIGYYEEALEMLRRMHKRGYRVVRARDLLGAD